MKRKREEDLVKMKRKSKEDLVKIKRKSEGTGFNR